MILHEDIILYYNKYLENLKNVVKIIPTTFFNPHDLIVNENNYWDNFNDKFLIDAGSNKKLLAEDIIRNGTYWPVMVDKNLRVIEGKHRIESLQKISDIEFHILTLKLEDKFVYKEMSEIGEYPSLQLPSSMILDSLPSDILDSYINSGCLKFNTNIKILILKENNSINFIRFFIKFSTWLSRKFYQYKNENGIMYPPSNIMMDENSFSKWANFIY